MSAAELEVHLQSMEQVNRWMHSHSYDSIRWMAVSADPMPEPKGGVGWARKLVMDEAARRLQQDGIILCLDADCEVAANYLYEVYACFSTHKECDAASIYFEHRLESLTTDHRQAITQYELHLRYLVQANRWTGHPFAYHTVGSSMAVRRRAYLAQGGMNTRQAGEDFYFLQKFIEVGPFAEITSTTVYPAARASSRVPFGTGRAMLKLQQHGAEWVTSDFKTFRGIKPFFGELDHLFELTSQTRDSSVWNHEMKHLDQGLLRFLTEIHFFDEILKIRDHTRNKDTFTKRFFRYFNAFMMIRYMHFMSRHAYPDVPVAFAASQLAGTLDVSIPIDFTTDKLLNIYRSLDKGKQGK